jgi:hypothetical protein
MSEDQECRDGTGQCRRHRVVYQNSKQMVRPGNVHSDMTSERVNITDHFCSPFSTEGNPLQDCMFFAHAAACSLSTRRCPMSCVSACYDCLHICSKLDVGIDQSLNGM